MEEGVHHCVDPPGARAWKNKSSVGCLIVHKCTKWYACGASTAISVQSFI